MEVVATIDEGQTKQLLKAVLMELIEEQPKLFSDIVQDALEDAGLVRAIREGRQNDYVAESEVMSILDD